MKKLNTYSSLNEVFLKPGESDEYAASKGIDVKVKSGKPPSELSNGGQVMKELIDVAAELEAMTGFQLTVTAGNDLFHKKHPRSNHNRGSALDFVSSSFSNKQNRKTMEQAILKLMLSGKYDKGGLRLGAINEYDKPTAHATGGHFHMSLTPDKERRDGYECNLTLSGIRSYRDIRKMKKDNVQVQDIKKADTDHTSVGLIQKGSTGDEVRDIQTTLMGLGYNLNKYGVDGIYGNETKNAVIAFQKDNKLPQTGVIDEKTKSILKSKTSANTKLQRKDQNNYEEKTISLSNGLILKILFDKTTMKIAKIASTSSEKIKTPSWGKEQAASSFESSQIYFNLNDFITEQDSIFSKAIDNYIGNKDKRKERRAARKQKRELKRTIKNKNDQLSSDNNILGDNEEISVSDLKKVTDDSKAFGLYKLKMVQGNYVLTALNQLAKTQIGGKSLTINTESDLSKFDNLFNEMGATNFPKYRIFQKYQEQNGPSATKALEKFYNVVGKRTSYDTLKSTDWLNANEGSFTKEEKSLIYSTLLQKLTKYNGKSIQDFPTVSNLEVSLSQIVDKRIELKDEWTKYNEKKYDDKNKNKETKVKELNPSTGLSYIDDSRLMKSNQKKNAKIIVAALNKEGITNPYIVRAILAVIGKETYWDNQPENLNYSKERLPEVWSVFSKTGKRVKKGQGKYNYNNLATQYERNPEKLANFVYQEMRNPKSPYFRWPKKKDRRYGNTSPGDGYKYRGAGFNQITFKGQYKTLQNITGIDLITRGAEGLVDPNESARVAAIFFKRRLNSSGRKLYGAKSIESVNNQSQANKIAAHANAGWGKDPSSAISSTNKINNTYFA